MRRRTKPRVVWLPQTNANSVGDGTQVYQFGIAPIGGTSGNAASIEIPMVLDAPQTAIGATDSSLADIENSGYRLRRIVGKVWVFIDQNPTGAAGNRGFAFVVTAGFIIRRVNPATGGSLAVQADAIQPFPTIDPGRIDNSGDPWIWRRSWLLGNNQSDTSPAQLVGPEAGFPIRNWGDDYAGGIAEGPHIDQKTARLVGPEERLFLDLTGTCLGEAGAPGPGDETNFVVFTDVRCLASMRSSMGNRRNASR